MPLCGMTWMSRSVCSVVRMQKKIHSAFQLMGFSVVKEHQVEALPIHLDIVTKGQGKNGEPHTVAVEVDGPSHFLHTPAGPQALNSATRFRNAALLLHGVHVRPHAPRPCLLCDPCKCSAQSPTH